MADAFDIAAKITLNTSDFVSSLDNVSGSWSGMQSTISAGTIAIGNAIAGMATKAISALTNFATSIVSTGAGFEASMSTVAATLGYTTDQLADSTSDEAQAMETLTAKAREMGSETKYSASEAAEAMNYMAMAGWSAEEMTEGLDGIMQLAAASGEDLGTTSDIVTDALTAFGMSADESTRFADVLAVTSSSANTNVSLMGETFKYVAALAGTMGYSVEDMAASIGIMANSGTKGSMAGTSLKNAIANLADPTEGMTTALGELGLIATKTTDNIADNADGVDNAATSTVTYNAAIQDSDGNMLSWRETIEALRDAFGDLDEAQQAAYASTLFGKESMAGMLSLINADDSEFEALYAAVDNATGASESMMNQAIDNLEGDKTIFLSALDDLKISVYDKLQDTLRDVTQFGTELVSGLSEGLNTGDFSGMLEGIGSALGTLGGKLESVNPELFEKISGAVSAFGTGLKGFPEESGTRLENIANSLGRLANVLKEETAELLGKIGDAIASFQAGFNGESSTASGTIENIANSLGKLAGNIADDIPGYIDSVREAIQAFSNGLKGESVSENASSFENVMHGIGEAVRFVYTHASELSPILGGLVTAFIAWEGMMVISSIPTMLATIGSALTALFAVIAANPIAAIVTVIAAIVGALVTAYQTNEEFRNSVDALWESLKNAAQVVGDFFTTLFTETIPQKFNELMAWFGSIVDKFVEIGSNIVNGIKDGFVNAWTSFKDTVTSFVSGVVDSVKDVLGIHSPSRVFAEIGKYSVMGFEEGFKSEFGKAENIVGSSFDSLATGKVRFDSSAIAKATTGVINNTLAQSSDGGGNYNISINVDGRQMANVIFDPLKDVISQRGEGLVFGK